MSGTTTTAGGPAGPLEKEPRRYRGRTPDERREQRRRRLLDAALDLFSSAGYQNTSVERLCSTSGVTGRHFYEEYPSREALLTALYDDMMASGMEAVKAALAEAPRELGPRLVAGVGAYMHLLLDDPRKARVVTVEVIGVSPQLEAHRREIGTMFALLIQAEAVALRQAGQKITGNELTALALVAAVHELTASWLASPTPIEIDTLIAEAVWIITAVAVNGSLRTRPRT
jgi:AcrR family transcriptional regulator